MLNCIACEKCESKRVAVLNSRKAFVLGFATQRRRRKCLECNSRFNTLEIPESFLQDVFGGEDLNE